MRRKGAEGRGRPWLKRRPEETKSLSRLYGGSSEDNPTNHPTNQAVNCSSHRKICLPCAGRSDSKREGVLANGLHVLLLTVGLGADHATATNGDAVIEDSRRARHLISNHFDDFGDANLVERVALLNQD